MHVYGSCSMHEIIFLRRGGVLVVPSPTDDEQVPTHGLHLAPANMLLGIITAH